MWAYDLPVVRWGIFVFVFLKQLLQGDEPVKKSLRDISIKNRLVIQTVVLLNACFSHY